MNNLRNWFSNVLHYPKIPDARGCPGGPCIAFEKYDGTNLHWSWDREFGWYAFGTRRDEFNLAPAGEAQFEAAHPNLIGAAGLFRATLAEPLGEILHWQAAGEGAKVFTEYFGPRSFAGAHVAGDDMRLVLFDVELAGFGLISPFDFVFNYRTLPVPRVIYRGRYTGQLGEDVRRGKYDVSEGVVVKGGAGESLWMVKIKTLAYQDRLRAVFTEGWQAHWE